MPIDDQLSLERVIPVAPEDLFELWIDPAELAKWWAPDGYECVVEAMDVKPGGRWRTLLRSGARTLAISGIYRVIDPPRQLIFTWAWDQDDGPGHETQVSVTFTAVPGGTRLALVHQRFEDRSARDRHSSGWSACCDRLIRLNAAA